MAVPRQALLEAFEKLEPVLRRDPDELARRLARRRLPILQRPPRAWCLAVRASDTRITAVSAPCVPKEGPQERCPHEVWIDSELLRALCGGVTIDAWGEEWTIVAKKLGVHEETLRYAMRHGVFNIRYIAGWRGKRGKPTPILHSFRLFDPSSANLKEPPDIFWGGLWRYHASYVPEDFEQPVEREPVLRPYPGSADRFRGWRWRCPACDQLVRTVYLPLPVPSFPEWYGSDLVPPADDPGHPDALPSPAQRFACHACHGVRFFHRANRDGWNQLVTYLSGGLLYGHEVERPADFYMRKKTYQPCLGREPSRRREEVRRMLVETDLTYRQMAEELGVGLQTVHNHVYEIYRRCRRNGLRAAAGVGPYRRPATAREIEKAARRRAVKDLLGRGFNRQAVARRMGVHVCTVYRDAQAMGFWKGGRRKETPAPQLATAVFPQGRERFLDEPQGAAAPPPGRG